MTIDDDFEVDGNLTVKTIPEGLFVTKSCVGVHDLGRAWKELGDWVKESKEYKFAPHQCLEENTNPKIEDGNTISFILYFPVKK